MSDTDNSQVELGSPKMGLSCQQLAELPRCSFSAAGGGGGMGSGERHWSFHRLKVRQSPQWTQEQSGLAFSFPGCTRIV